MSFTDYSASVPGGPGGGSPAVSGQEEPKVEYWDLSKLKRAVSDYLGNKSAEIEEQKNARRYYHGSQWTAEQISVLKKRNQPPMTDNRIARKIDGVVGLIERMRQDPKAFPRTPQHEEGAELATASIRFVLDEQRWKEKSPEVARDGAIDGIAGIEINIEAGDQGDPNIGIEIVEPDSFIYDPRSYRADFSDAAYLGIGKWMDLDIAQAMFPGADFGSLDYTVGELTSNPDRERRWFDSVKKRVRVVDLWYKHKGEWCYALFTGAQKLMEGPSYLKDEKNKTFCKYIMYSANVDQDGDRYAFVRNLKSAQDGINARQSKLQHILSSRRLVLQKGSVKDVEVARREWARPDGVIETIGPVSDGMKADDQSFDFAGWSKMMEMSLASVENFGPNPELLGVESGAQSGRAIQLKQNAGLAQLGPYLMGFKGWKLRVYRAVWNALRTHWTAERWIRVTDDQGLAEFVGVNRLGVDPRTGMPAIINKLGALDVDIIIDEGADQINMQADAYDTLTVLASQGERIPPQVMIELSPLAGSVKKKIMDMLNQAQQPNPAQQLQAAMAQAKVQDTQAHASLNAAMAVKALADAQQPVAPQTAQPFEMPPQMQMAQASADINATNAKADHTRAQAFKTTQDALLAPHQMHMDMFNAEADRQLAAKQQQQRTENV